MRVSTFAYTLKQGIKNIWRNKMFSLASIATMSACIFLFGLFYSIVVNFQSVVKEVESGVAVTVFFNEGIDQTQIDTIGNEIDKRVEVSKKKFVSADEAWAEYQKQYFEGNEEMAQGFVNDNPLANSAHYEIYMNDISMQQSLVTYLESLDGVRDVKSSDVAANTLSDFNRLLGYISAGIILILLCVAVFLISNTVTVGIAVRREEIAIMKLIGATDYFVRAPFIVEGILIGLIGSALPLGVLYLMYRNIIVYIGEKFHWLSNIMNFLPVDTVFSTLLPVGLLLGVGIGFLGSRFTIRKHLKV
ncbi:permease-like cell division protein FtsX [Roseburia sp. MSJ-14]|uniref:permease-like cell division protein FtsX n=1 Tax=Roseburia sp. MSJ-14 TaxID=2841514 RepID=UPI001C0FA901|nr:permease-like cell division protein FtsX [Roseburia sp. MSJ-14]MBU5474967.1 permease-like cell division protein FtsX [Roseburia sp. MSJ-14]